MAERVKNICGHLAAEKPPRIALSGTSAVAATLPMSPLEYTVDPPRGAPGLLTAEQRRSYEENGFLVIKNTVPLDKLEKYRQHFEKICNGEIVNQGLTVMKDVSIAKTKAGEKGQGVITKIQNFQDDPVLFEYCATPEIVKYVTAIIGENVMSMHTMLINKPPDPGTKSSRHPMHQDLHYFPFRPANRIVCAWTAMERVHRDNGCLVVVPGTHKGDLLEHEYPEWEGGVNKMYHGVKGYNPSMERIWVEMDAGDTVLFHPILLHGSGTNRTKGFRKAISCHYAASDCEYIDVKGTIQEEVSEEMSQMVSKMYGNKDHKIDWRAISCHYAASECDYIDVKGTIQEHVAEEVLDVVERKFGKDARDALDYRDVWKVRARLVNGVEINI